MTEKRFNELLEFSFYFAVRFSGNQSEELHWTGSHGEARVRWSEKEEVVRRLQERPLCQRLK